MEFLSNYGLIILLVVLLGFMFWSSRRRMQKQKLEQEQKARQTVPGAEVLLQGGLYGTIVAFDPENLDQPALVEIAPGVEIKVHSQAILRVVDPVEGTVTEDDFIEAEANEAGYVGGVASGSISSISDDQARAEATRRPSTPTPTRTPSPRPDRSPSRAPRKLTPRGDIHPRPACLARADRSSDHHRPAVRHQRARRVRVQGELVEP